MNSQACHTELTLCIAINYKSFGLLDAKVMGVLNPVTFLAQKPTLPGDYQKDKLFRDFLDPCTHFETMLTRQEQTQLQVLVKAISERIFAECYPESEQP